MKKKACKSCNKLVKVDQGNCDNCKKNAFANNFQGQINVLNADKSFVAKKIGINRKGEYAIKIN